jgi:hypothetical protein
LPPDDPRAENFLRELHRRAEERQTLRGVARFSLDSPDLRFRRPQRVALQRPAMLRVEVLALFGQTAGVLATDGQRYSFLDVGTRELQSGQVTPELLWQVGRIDLTAEQAVDLLLGSPAPAPGLLRGPLRGREDGVVELPFLDAAGRVRQRFEVGAEGELSRLETLDADGELRWAAVYSSYRDVDGEAFAFEVELQFPRVGANAKFDFRSVELNPELPEGIFSL